jgi:hypothetical protein
VVSPKSDSDSDDKVKPITEPVEADSDSDTKVKPITKPIELPEPIEEYTDEEWDAEVERTRTLEDKKWADALIENLYA